ncbi:GNAT family protein [Halovibrio sp. HP20-50]|uniref:GNAT family N-acetyltransferase n=1 Tax=Halovibrio sp. HP20-59 TaxID=3080275 RepID=UPI00294AE2D4|nr:GNAT family protein [Halovibrio sp. HP20-59]MEA2119268.1 GNAT family protein [Halovibrio sp. HP20-59]
MEVSPVTLKGKHVELKPLKLSHRDAFFVAASDGELWASDLTIVPASPEATDEYIREAIEGQESGIYLPFVIIHRQTGRVVGTTRYRAINFRHRRLEIGSTWLAKSAQRTAVNTESKFLLLQHAFEHLGCLRVEFLTDALNQQSRAAIERLGATLEGILRMHMVMPSGRSRDSAYFSIIETEWPTVRDRLESKLGERS